MRNRPLKMGSTWPPNPDVVMRKRKWLPSSRTNSRCRISFHTYADYLKKGYKQPPSPSSHTYTTIVPLGSMCHGRTCNDSGYKPWHKSEFNRKNIAILLISKMRKWYLYRNYRIPRNTTWSFVGQRWSRSSPGINHGCLHISTIYIDMVECNDKVEIRFQVKKEHGNQLLHQKRVDCWIITEDVATVPQSTTESQHSNPYYHMSEGMARHQQQQTLEGMPMTAFSWFVGLFVRKESSHFLLRIATSGWLSYL